MKKNASAKNNLAISETAISAEQSADNERRILVAEHSEEFSGPLPHPETLAKYEEVFPGAADRIFKMAEAQAEHRRSMERDSLKLAARDSLLGIICGFIITIGVMGIGLFIIIRNPSSSIALVTGGILSGTSLLGIIQTFVLGTKKRKDHPKDGA